jgi:CspA family cold shock protein
MPHGGIKKFDEKKGYGFIRPDGGGEDIFFHCTALHEDDDIAPGKRVIFEIDRDTEAGKTRAVTVDLVDALL